MTIIDGFQFILTLESLMVVSVGVLVGCIIGAIPGLSGSMLIALMLPFTVHLKSSAALVLLVGIYIGAVSGGLITAALLRVPGTAASIVTTFDGYPMARAGRPERAIGLGILASFIGGFISWFVLVSAAPMLARVALKFSTFERASLVLMSMIMIASVGSGSFAKAIISGMLGMALALPGIDPVTAMHRLSFGSIQMLGGLPIIPILIGLFGVGQILNDILELKPLKVEAVRVSLKRMFPSFSELKKSSVNLFRSSLIGTGIGILPGAGATLGSITAYSVAQSASKTPEKFGHGSEEGIMASEAANNATISGALIPTLTLGIPGSPITALMLAAFVLHNVPVGPLLFRDQPEVVYGIMATVFVANILMFVFMIGLTFIMARITEISKRILTPTIFAFCILGSYASNNRFFDVWVMLGFGGLGFLMEKAKIPLSPFIIGFILTPMLERNLRSALMQSRGSFLPFLTRPISAAFLLVAVASILFSIYSSYRKKTHV